MSCNNKKCKCNKCNKCELKCTHTKQSNENEKSKNKLDLEIFLGVQSVIKPRKSKVETLDTTMIFFHLDKHSHSWNIHNST